MTRRRPPARTLAALAAGALALTAAVLAVLPHGRATAPTLPPLEPVQASARVAVLGLATARTTHCARWASPSGSDAGRGTRRRPFATVQRLVDALGPGQTGCLLAGRYTGAVTVRHGGLPGRPLTLSSAPGVIATVAGRLWIARTADWVTVTHLFLDGRNAAHLPSPTVDGNHVTFSDDDVTNYRMGGHSDGDGICFDLGDPTGHWGIAHDTLIVHDTIHDCGTSDNHNHGIYVAGSVGARIVGNWIWDNGDRGVQLYPDAQHTLVEGNIIAGNGEGVIISGDATQASSNNLVTRNVIVDSRIRHNVEYWWPGSVGTHNVVSDNCLYGGHEGNLLLPAIGYTPIGNRIVRPRFLSASQPTTVAPHTPCAAFAPRLAATPR